MKTRIDKNTDTSAIFSNPVVINGMPNGYIDRLEIVGRKSKQAEFLCVVVNSPGLMIDQLILTGWNIESFEDWQEYAPSGLLVSPDSPGVVVNELIAESVNIGFRLESEGARVEGGRITNFAGDGFQLCADDTMARFVDVSGCLEIFGDAIHGDVGQLFRKGGGKLSGAVVESVTYRASGHEFEKVPQGILASDSEFSDCIVRDCDLQGVHDSHGISFLVPAINCIIAGNKTNGLIRAPYGNEISGNDARVLRYVPYLTKRVDFMSKQIEVSSSVINSVASELGIQPAKVRALIRVENGSNDRVLFERHVFYEQLIKAGVDVGAMLSADPSLSEIINPVPYKIQKGKRGPDFYGKYEDSNRRLTWAAQVHKEAAYCSASFYYFQIMGFHFADCGFSSAYDFAQAMQADPDVQVRSVALIIRKMGIDDELRRDDFSGFARRYVGPNYKRGTKSLTDDYDWKFAKFYRQELALEQPSKPTSKSKTMRATVGGVAATVAGGGVISGNIPDIDSIKAFVDTVTDNAEKLDGMKEQLTGLSQSVDAMSWLPLAVVGFGVVTVGLLGVIAYAYLTDNGHMRPFGGFREAG